MQFETGEAIALDVARPGGALRLEAWIADQTSDGLNLTLTCAAPETLPEAGDAVVLSQFRGDGVRYGDATVVKISWPSIVVAKPENVRVVQRRQSFRVRCDVPLKYTLMQQLQPAPAGPLEGTARTCDISAGGIRFRGKGPIPIGSVVRLELRIDGPQPLVVITKLGRSEGVPNADFWEMSGRFVDLQRGDEARLARYVLRCELAQRAADRK